VRQLHGALRVRADRCPGDDVVTERIVANLAGRMTI
jgi:hypothetical protein